MAALIVLTLLGAASVLLAVRAERDLARTRRGGAVPFGRWSGAVAAVFALALGLAAFLAATGDPLDRAWAAAAVAVALVAAVAGGAPLSLAILHLADPDPQVGTPPPATTPAASPPAAPAAPATPATPAGPADPWLLRGGFWIGLLERAAIAFTLLAGWPEGVAVVLAVKGFGRYPELKFPPAAERFIIGTLVSVVWASACAWTALRLLG